MIRPMRHLPLVAAALFVSATPGGISIDAQVVAKQGAPATTDFRSPMILEIAMPNLVGAPVGAAASLGSQLAGYSCDGVSVPALRIRIARRRDGQDLELELSGTVKVPPSHDRLVDLDFVVLGDSKTLAVATARRIDAEEDRTTVFKTRMRLSEATLRDAFALTPSPILQLTVTVVSND